MSRTLPYGLPAILLLAAAGHAELARWIQDIPSPSRLEAVFFRAVTLPMGAVEVRRPPKETRAELGRLIAAAPADAELYALRAREDEQQLDFNAAESDWKKHLELASDKPAAWLDLADFYERRLRPRDQIAALDSAAKAPPRASERWTPVSAQQSWKTFQRILAVAKEQALPPDAGVSAYRSWIARYPSEPSVYRQFEQYLVDSKQFDEAQKLIADYRKAFPADDAYPLEANATIAWRRGSLDDAVRLYDQRFRPLWPPELVSAYFNLLKESHGLRRYLEQARSQIAARPTDLTAAARVFYYYQQQGNAAAAQRALFEYRLRKTAAKSAWTADELSALAQFFEALNNNDEAARSYYALYSLPGASAAVQEKALAGIANLLLVAPEQGIRFGANDLSMYRDIAQLDSGPGFLNGVLSLLFNSNAPQEPFATEDAASVAYFHRGRAAELLRLFDSKFPASDERPKLHAGLIAAYAVYGDNDAVIRAGREFLTAFPKAGQRLQVATLLADAYARKNQVPQELALYDDLLKELAALADGAPIGDASMQSPAPARPGQQPQAEASPARSPEYARILDRYISRLVALKRTRDALALYRREIDRNPNDPGLYERLAGFLEENKMGADVEQTYRRAMAQFSDRSWSHKLARWYLRQKQSAQYDQLTQEVVKIFSGTELESYLRDTAGAELGAVLYRQVNLYAHQRFPHNLTFVHNLLNAYAQRGTADPAASEALLRKYWYYAPDLRDRFFELLSRTRRLDAEFTILKNAGPANPATTELLAEANAWRSHFEEAAPLMQAASADFPADSIRGTRAASVFRSLATYDAPGDIHNLRLAANIEQGLTRATPRDSGALTRLGEIYADRELFARAKPGWDRIPQIQPGQPNGYIEAATIYWDYFRYADAMRIIDDGRRKLNDPALFAYEAGAIYENERNYPRAIAEYAKGALASENSPARGRLLVLSRRPRDRDAIEQLTAREVAGADPAMAAVSLRTDLLFGQNRRPDVEQFLTGLADRASSLELLAYIEQTGSRNEMPNVQEHAIRRQIAVLTDPVERLRERLTLARFYEGRHDIDAARGVMSALYREYPTTLGVVRATVDFYWRSKNEKNAVDVLVQAAAASQPSYRKQFNFEAARKATESADYARARTLLAGLLKDDPFNAEYLAATGDAYSREGNDRGLRDFYTAKLKEIAAAPLSAPERIEKTAGLRRGLIPVLARLKDYAGAVDQYIEVINRYPEDESLVREAALFAAAHGRAQQLTAYYAKTESDSPKDYRWPMTLARIQTSLEDFPAAIAEYRRATDVRPDRADLFTTRASLEERLLRFDDALADYSKLYELSYHNSAWMEKIAEIRARQGKTSEAVEALRRALVEGRPQKPDVFFAMAERLENWGLLPQAREYAEKAVNGAAEDLLTDYSSGAVLYARVMTRTRAQETAYRKLTSLIQDPAGKPAPHPELDAPLRQIGMTVAQYFTPEEKLAFANFLGANLPTIPASRVRARLPMAEAAGLADLQAKWQNQLLRADPASPPQALVALQQRRLRFGELAGQLEAYWKIYPTDKDNRDSLLGQAAGNFRLAGDSTNELRVLAQLEQLSGLSGDQITRYAELLNRNPQRYLAVVSGGSDAVRDALATYTLENGTAARAFEVIGARGKGLPPVWTRAFTGLAGLYFASPSPQVMTAFREALGTATISERVGKPVDTDQQLVAAPWFYYGSRFGEYLQLMKQPEAEDYLPAGLEAQPAHADAYFTLAEFYRESGEAQRAMTDYENSLQLDGNRADAHDRMGLLLWQQNKREDATREFRTALEAFSKQEDQRHVPENFWRALSATLDDIGQCKLLPALRPQADRVLRTYVRRNGSYAVDLLLRAAIRATGDPAAGVAWILDLSKAAPDQPEFLSAIVHAAWIPEDQRPAIYAAMIQSAQQKLQGIYGEARNWAETELRNKQFEWVEYLVDHKQIPQARAALADIPEDLRKARAAQTVPLETRIAAQSGTLAALLDGYAKNTESEPPLAELQKVAGDLQARGDAASARQVLEFVYTRQLDARDFNAPAFLGLAEIRMDQGDLKAAVALLRRMTLVTGEPFENLDDAAELLSRKGHPAEALEFLNDRVRAVPWDQAARVQLGKLEAAAAGTRDRGLELLRTAAMSNDASYEARLAAAQSLAELKAGAVSAAGTELNLLSSGAPIPPADAQKPYFYRARLASAAQTSDAATKIRLLDGAAAVEPNADETKLALFDAAYAAKRYQTALSAVFPLLARNGVAAPAESQQPASPGQIVDEQPEPTYFAEQFLGLQGVPYSRRAPNAVALPAARRAVIARQIADAHARVNHPREAAFFYGIALQLQPGDRESRTQLTLLQAQLERQRVNRQRQPVVSANLEQDHPVRPRLAAAASAQGGGQ